MSLPVIFVAVSVIELLVLAAVEDRIGLGPTLAIILFTGILGASLVRSQGFGVLSRVRRQMNQGTFPGRELAHGALVLVGGALLLTPGFITDAPWVCADGARFSRSGAGARHEISATAGPPMTIRSASTVCLLRPEPDGMEVLMVRRSSASVFVGGAYVFPGGAVDGDDHSDLARQAVCRC